MQANSFSLRSTLARLLPSDLTAAFESVNETFSGLKDTLLSISGSMAALTHRTASDESLKDPLATFAMSI